MDPHFRLGRSALWGRHRGRRLSARQAQLLETLLPQIAIDASHAIVDPAGLFPTRPQELWLEIGFGGGEHLAAEALARPNIGVIGSEFFLNGIAKALALIEGHQLKNVRLYNGDARVLIDALPPHALAGVYLLYPDPWPKRRHRARRLLSEGTLAALARVMHKGAQLRFATDVDAIAASTLAHVLRSAEFAWDTEEAVDWRRPWPGWTGTRYEAKAVAEGRRPAYFTLWRK